MCGRVLGYLDLQTVRRLSRAGGSRRAKRSKRGFNLAPTTNQLVLIHSSLQSLIPQNSQTQKPSSQNPRFLTSQTWGITLTSSKKSHFNIRVESADSLFPRLLQNRSVMIVEGYYEWKDTNPYLIKPKSKEIFYLACVFDVKDSNFECAVITCEAPKDLKWLHNRVPCIVEEKDVDQWIDPRVRFEEVRTVLVKPSVEDFEVVRVSKLVNNVRNDSKDCCLKIEDFVEKRKSEGIAKFFQVVGKRKAEEVKEEKEIKPE